MLFCFPYNRLISLSYKSTQIPYTCIVPAYYGKSPGWKVSGLLPRKFFYFTQKGSALLPEIFLISGRQSGVKLRGK